MPLHVELFPQHALQLLRIGRVAHDPWARILLSLGLRLEELPKVAEVRVRHPRITAFEAQLLRHPAEGSGRLTSRMSKTHEKRIQMSFMLDV